MTTVRFYQVNAWEGPSATNKYGRHLCIGVVTHSAMRAILMTQELYAAARIDAVNERGIVHMLDEHETTEPGSEKTA